MPRLIPTELYAYSLSDTIIGLRAAFGPGRPLEDIDLPLVGKGVPVRSARAGIIVALQALGLGTGARIGVPLYCCPVVFKSVRAVGGRPVFLDVDPGTFCLSVEDLRAKAAGLDAVIAVHMFGNLCEVPAVLEAMVGKPVIEDCAQALGSRLQGRPAGSLGTVSVFSYRLGKYLSAGEGASIHAASPQLGAAIRRLVSELAVPTRADELKHPIDAWARSLLRREPLWALAGSSLWQVYNRKTDFMEKSPIVISRMFRSDREILRRRLSGLDRLIQSQRGNAQYYIDHLEIDRSRLCFEKPGAFANRFMFPIVLDSGRERDLLRAGLKKRGVGAATPYEEVVEGAASNYGYERNCPTAERLLKTALVIPCHHALTRKDRSRVVVALNEGWAETIGRNPAWSLKRD
jgi:perosamine synthetase